jgi:hypothetical protein
MTNQKFTITLDATEQAIAEGLARRRFNAARKAGVANAKIGPQSNHLTDLEGIGSEFAFCKLFNLFPDLTVGARKGGHDCLLDSFKVDVKSTKYKSGKLLARTSKTLDDADIYALMIGEFPTYEFVGWSLNKELLKQENIINLGHGEGYGLTQNNLKRPGSLKNARNLIDV